MLLEIDQFIELIEEFAKLYRPVCVGFIQLYLSDMLFARYQGMRKSGRGSSTLLTQMMTWDIHKSHEYSIRM